jgi:hypothetical protein
VHIELTDHLRCPEDHAEAFLVLLPEQMDGRRVVAGHLGCPACGWNTAWRDGIPDFGSGARSSGSPPCDATAVLALLGVVGSGGWLALAGSAGAIATSLAALLPGVNLVAVNPPPSVEPSDAISVIVSGTWPIKAHAMRGVVLGGDADDLRDAAVQSVLPGLRAVGFGEPPQGSPGVDVIGVVEGLWVVRRR